MGQQRQRQAVAVAAGAVAGWSGRLVPASHMLSERRRTSARASDFGGLA